MNGVLLLLLVVFEVRKMVYDKSVDFIECYYFRGWIFNGYCNKSDVGIWWFDIGKFFFLLRKCGGFRVFYVIFVYVWFWGVDVVWDVWVVVVRFKVFVGLVVFGYVVGWYGFVYFWGCGY